MSGFLHFLELLATSVLALAALGWLLYRWLKTTQDDPGRLVFKWVLTALILAALGVVAGPLARSGGPEAALLVPVAAICGLFFAVVWLPNVLGAVARPFMDLYTGGSSEPDPQAAFSIAEAKRKRGNYQEAMAEIRKELEQFPTDYPGQMLLAEIQAEDLKDLPAAQATIEQLLQQEGHARQNIALALNRLADWHLKLGQQPEAAQQILEQISQLYPGSEEAYLAAQRIAHLNPQRVQEQKQEARRLTLVHHEEKLGLQEGFTGLKAAPIDYEAQAAAWVEQLEKHPADSEARENLAVLYARQFDRLDLATDQLEQLIGQAGAPTRQVVRWLNLLADLQVSVGHDGSAARRTLQRIVDRFPHSADAEKAQKRMAYLAIELKAQQAGRAVRLQDYEQNLGLRSAERGPPESRR